MWGIRDKLNRAGEGKGWRWLVTCDEETWKSAFRGWYEEGSEVTEVGDSG